MLRLHLPPNLSAAAPRDAIAVRVELDPATPPPAALLPALGRLQGWCGGAAQPPPFLQLTRAQLRELVQLLAGQPVFFRVDAPGKPLLWIGPRLRGVSEHLDEPVPRPAAAPAPSRPLPAAPRPSALPVVPATPMLVDGSEHFLAIALPSREHSAHAAALELVKANGFTLEPANRKWWLRDRHKVLNFLARHLGALRDEFHADFTPNFEKNTGGVLKEASISCEIEDRGGEFAVTLGFDAGRAGEEALRSAVASGRGYIEDGRRIYLLAPAQLETLRKAQQVLAGGTAATAAGRRTHRISVARIPEVQALVEELAPHYQPPAAWRARAEALRNLSTLAPVALPPWFAADLRPYQRLGAAWLAHLHRQGLGGILADEMGLGKTLQALALLAGLHAAQSAPSLVVCPASLVENWRREAARFAPGLRVFTHHGSSRVAGAADAAAHDVVVTSYGTLARDQELFAEIDWACLIADEAQHAKNRRTLNARALRSLHAAGRFLLTGTPVENSLDDLRGLFEILMPGYVEALPSGLRGGDRSWHDERLRAQTAPYILRRTKSAVAPELPAKIEQVLYCEPAPAQAALYHEWQRKSEQELDALAAEGANEASLRLATLTQLLRLRQICCDPRLVSDAARATDSAKLDVFRELLSEAVDDGHRLLVFSQFTSLLALVRAELEQQEIPHCYLDGSMPVRQRQAEVDRFNASADIPVFLISLKAGGTGLNLTGADTVVHFDPWWNPAVEAQATDRAHRIGQTRIVTSYKLICTGTVEEKVLALQEQKRALLADVFEASDAASARLSLTDLRELLHTS